MIFFFFLKSSLHTFVVAGIQVLLFPQLWTFNFIYSVLFQTDFFNLYIVKFILFFFPLGILSRLEASVVQNYRKEFYPSLHLILFMVSFLCTEIINPLEFICVSTARCGCEVFARMHTSGHGLSHVGGVCALYLSVFGVRVVLAEQK